jgi:hypothetical protein
MNVPRVKTIYRSAPVPAGNCGGPEYFVGSSIVEYINKEDEWLVFLG